jgi:ribosomal protein L37E
MGNILPILMYLKKHNIMSVVCQVRIGRKTYNNINISISHCGNGDLAKWNTMMQKCMLIWQIKLLQTKQIWYFGNPFKSWKQFFHGDYDLICAVLIKLNWHEIICNKYMHQKWLFEVNYKYFTIEDLTSQFPEFSWRAGWHATKLP